MSSQKGELHRAQADASSITATWNREVQMLLDELRAKCLAALTSPAKGKPRVDEFNDAIARAQEIYDTSENALRARLQSQQDKINELLSNVEAAESVLSPLRNALTDVVEIATAKRDATLALARSRELLALRTDPQPLGSWSYTYDDEGGRLFGAVHGALAQAAPAPSAAFSAPAYPPPTMQQQQPTPQPYAYAPPPQYAQQGYYAPPPQPYNGGYAPY